MAGRSDLTCKRCKAKLVNGLQCSICNNSYHPSCAKLYPHILFLENNMIQCCMTDGDSEKACEFSVQNVDLGNSDSSMGNTVESPTIPVDNNKSSTEDLVNSTKIEDDFLDVIYEMADSNKVDVRIVNYIVLQKNLVIKELQDKVKLLSDQLALISSHPVVLEKSIIPDTTTCNLELQKILTPYDAATTVSTVCNASVSELNNTSLFIETPIEQSTSGNTQHLINHEESGYDANNSINYSILTTNQMGPNNHSISTTASHLDVSSYAAIVNRKFPVIIGKKSSHLKSVSKFSWIFVSRFSTEVTITDIQEYLKNSGVQQFDCSELIMKYNTYKSFKIGVPLTILPNVLNSDFWPVGILVKKFYFPSNNDNVAHSKGFLDKPAM